MPTKNEISEFSENVIKFARENRVNLIDSVVLYCESIGLEIDVASSLLSSSLKASIRGEAEDLNLLKRNAKLPL